MKKALLSILLFAALSAAGERWLTVPVQVTTNRVAVTLGNEFTPPKVLLGYWHAPGDANANLLTFTLLRGQQEWYTRTDAFTNNVIRVVDLGLIVKQGDVLVFTNAFTTGVLYLNYQVD